MAAPAVTRIVHIQGLRMIPMPHHLDSVHILLDVMDPVA